MSLLVAVEEERIVKGLRSSQDAIAPPSLQSLKPRSGCKDSSLLIFLICFQIKFVESN
jgi:hypothetical protein